MPTEETLVIVGASLAGAKVAEGARDAGYEGRIVLVGDEAEKPYERPPLSKAVLRGDDPPAKAMVHDDSYYGDHAIDLRLGEHVESIDARARSVQLASGESLAFTSLVLATGAEPRRLDTEGADLDGVHYLRSLEDSVRLHDAISEGGRIGVIGAGWIGCEVTASARQMGTDVLLVDPSTLPLQRVLGAEMGEVFRRLHAEHEVQMRLGTGVTELRGDDDGRVAELVLSNGAVEEVDFVVVGVGVEPRVALAAAAGLEVDNGVVVDELLQSAVPGIFAAGDVASAWHPHYGRHLRVEHWSNALNQGKAAGANVAGAASPYTRLPYFFTDQYDLGMEYVGFNDPGDDVVVRGDLAGREFVAFWQRDSVVTAAMAVNMWDLVDDLRAVVASKRVVPAERLGDPDIAFLDLVR